MRTRIGGVDEQLADIKFIPQTVAPATDAGAYQLYDRTAFGPIVKDKSGIEHPLAEGAGAAIRSITAAQSPYAVLETDRVLLVDTGAGAVTITLPAAGGPFPGRPLEIVDKARNFAVNNCTLDGNGNNVNAAATLVLATQDGGVKVRWRGATWERAAIAAGAMGAHASTHRAGGADDLLSAPGAIGGGTPAAGSFTTLGATGAVSFGTDITGAAEVNHNISVAASTTVSTAGGALNDIAGTGSAGTAGAAGATGGARQVRGGVGGAGHAAQVAGAGGALSVKGGAAGADGGGGGNNGGNVLVDGGVPTGAGVGGIVNIGTADTSVVNIGKAANSVGFFGVAAATQPTAYTQTFATADKTHANPTAATLTDNSGGTAADTVAAITNAANAGSADVAPVADAIATFVREQARLKADHADLAALVNSVIDDLQALGLVA
jgi:hypothetical protein